MKQNADIDSIIRSTWDSMEEVPVSIYFDAGTSESFYPPNLMLNSKLATLTQEDNYEIDYKYLEFEGGHRLTEEKIDSSLIWMNTIFSKIVTSAPVVNAASGADLRIFPNPSNGSVRLSLKSKDNAGEYFLQILSFEGRVLHNQSVLLSNGSEHEVNLPNLKAGAYFLVLKAEGKSQALLKKLIRW